MYVTKEQAIALKKHGYHEPCIEITFGGERKLSTIQPLSTNGAGALKIAPYKSMPKEAYWFRIDKQNKITTNNGK